MIMVPKNVSFTMSLPEVLNKIPSTKQNKSFETKTKQNLQSLYNLLYSWRKYQCYSLGLATAL